MREHKFISPKQSCPLSVLDYEWVRDVNNKHCSRRDRIAIHLTEVWLQCVLPKVKPRFVTGVKLDPGNWVQASSKVERECCSNEAKVWLWPIRGPPSETSASVVIAYSWGAAVGHECTTTVLVTQDGTYRKHQRPFGSKCGLYTL